MAGNDGASGCPGESDHGDRPESWDMCEAARKPVAVAVVGGRQPR
jgi:hypothetical protein